MSLIKLNMDNSVNNRALYAVLHYVLLWLCRGGLHSMKMEAELIITISNYTNTEKQVSVLTPLYTW